MPVATTLPAARDVQAMQQRRRLEGGGNSIENSLTFYFGKRFCLSGEYFQLNWLPDRREGLFLQLVAPLDVPHSWDG